MTWHKVSEVDQIEGSVWAISRGQSLDIEDFAIASTRRSERRNLPSYAAHMRHQRLACALAWTVLALIPLCGSFFSPGSLLLPVSQSGAFCRPQTAAAIFRRDRRASGPAIWCSSSQPPLPPPRPPLKAIDRKEVGARLRDLVSPSMSPPDSTDRTWEDATNRIGWPDWVPRGEQQDRAKRGHANADDVLDLLRWMTDNGVQLELRNYTALLNACAAAAKFGGVPLAFRINSFRSFRFPGFTRKRSLFDIPLVHVREINAIKCLGSEGWWLV